MAENKSFDANYVEEAGGKRSGGMGFLEQFQLRYAKVDPASYLRRPDETGVQYWGRRLGTLKPVELLHAEYGNTELRQYLNWWQLVFIGIGAIIGTGIFVLSGQAAAQNAGPAVTVSFIVAAFASCFAAMSYSELASMIPVSGSAYTYAYATMGEFVAWILGWDLILEYMVGAATVGVGWSGYFKKFFGLFGIVFADSWTEPTVIWDENPARIYYEEGHAFNVPGFVVIMLITIVLCVGIRQSSWVNSVIVIIKLIVVVLFIFAMCGFVDRSNYDPYVPPNTSGDWHYFGAPGIFAAASTVFFAYIGFDSVTTAAMEAKNPKRDLPIGIIGSLVVTTVLYIAFCTVMTGAAPYTELNTATPVITAIEAVEARTGRSWLWLKIITIIGALAGLSSVILIMLLGQTRVFYSMAKDGLFPQVFAKVHPRFKTPYIATITVGSITALLSAVLPVDLLGNMTSVGTLLAFFIVHAGVIVLRFTRPDVERWFKIPGGKYFFIVFPILGMVICVLLIAVAEVTTIWRLFVWMGVGWVIYFAYGVRHAKLHRDPIGRFAEVHAHADTSKEEVYPVQDYDYQHDRS
ncbi:amino acid permease-domain-containing protein [Zychaea mexicana]|uniref:amino acid permease-domain-containing protein n=1 Tax=Zychaea mexicana TaxID=64656 RepID=UPI0022FE1503|nr:amino acid permease-domain-containing protein [Zychaea mexicana]KAI9495056.1 amino acid permease-domain-containing protein [Zychaea mexicana]